MEILHAGDLDGLAPFVAFGFVTHDHLADQGSDVQGFHRGYALFRAAFPDFQLSIEDMVAGGDRVENLLPGAFGAVRQPRQNAL